MLEHFLKFGDYMKYQSMYYYRACQIKKAKNRNYYDKVLNLQLWVKVCEHFGMTEKHTLLNTLLSVINTAYKPFTVKSEKVCESQNINPAFMNTANFPLKSHTCSMYNDSAFD